MPSNHLILCGSFLLLPSISLKVFSNESALFIRWPKYWSFSFNISLSNEYSGLISFRIDWFWSPCSPRSLLAVLRVFSNTTVQKHQFFGAQPLLWLNSHTHSYMTTGKTIALTRRTFVCEVMSLIFNMLSRLVITFLPRSKHLLISWLQLLSAVILELKKIKSVTISVVSPSNLPWSDGTGFHDLHFLNVEF